MTVTSFHPSFSSWTFISVGVGTKSTYLIPLRSRSTPPNLGSPLATAKDRVPIESLVAHPDESTIVATSSKGDFVFILYGPTFRDEGRRMATSDWKVDGFPAFPLAACVCPTWA
jgi:hypothetical protein